VTVESGLAPYRRAIAAAWFGLGVQVVLVVASLTLHAYAGAESLLRLALLSVAGIPMWACIGVVYVFQRQKRIEELELERDQESGAGSIFADDVQARPATRRLRRAYRWGLPAISALSGAYLLIIGLSLIRQSARAGVFAEHAAGFAAFAAGIAFVLFVVARYLFGMAEIAVWRLLRGGASFLLGCVTMLFLVALGLGVAHFGSAVPLQALAVAVPVFSMVIGAEILLNQVLDLYRPRHRDETPRPAFDSRLLSLLANPVGVVQTLSEAINYQFGFEITRSWFWRLLTRTFGWLILIGVAVVLLVSCIVIVDSHERALVVRLGRLVGEPLDPGIHLKLPWPISVTEHYDVTRVRELTVGSHDQPAMDKPLLWSNQHSIGPERLMMLAPPRDTVTRAATSRPAADDRADSGAAAPAITLAGADVFIQYRIADVLAFARNQADAERRFRELADQEVSRFLLRLDIDELIGPGRTAAALALQTILREAARRERLGLEVIWVGIAGIHPAQQAADAFHETVGAEQEKQTAVLQAMKDATRTLAEAAGTELGASRIETEIEALERMQSSGRPQPDVVAQEARVESLIQAAGGKAAELLADARAYRWRIENAERGRGERFLSELAGYQAVPSLYRMRKHLDALAEGMAEARKYLLATDRQDLIIRGDLKDATATFESMNLKEAK
jgi:modulator of FtsH protease HflK